MLHTGELSPLRLCWEPRQEDRGVLVGCSALGMGGGRGCAPEQRGSLGSDPRGRLGVAGDGDGVLPFKRSRLEPPMWLEWFDPGWVPALAGWGRLPRGRRKRWSSSSLLPNKARLREGGGSMVLSPVSCLPVPVPRLVVISHWQLGKIALFLFRVDIFPSAVASSPSRRPLYRSSVCALDVRVSPLPTQMFPPSL